MWIDPKSKIDYQNFGAVMCFGSYTNAYLMPFVPIVGINNHLQIVIFGCALILDARAPRSYGHSEHGWPQ